MSSNDPFVVIVIVELLSLILLLPVFNVTYLEISQYLEKVIVCDSLPCECVFCVFSCLCSVNHDSSLTRHTTNDTDILLGFFLSSFLVCSLIRKHRPFLLLPP